MFHPPEGVLDGLEGTVRQVAPDISDSNQWKVPYLKHNRRSFYKHDMNQNMLNTPDFPVFESWVSNKSAMELDQIMAKLTIWDPNPKQMMQVWQLLEHHALLQDPVVPTSYRDVRDLVGITMKWVCPDFLNLIPNDYVQNDKLCFWTANTYRTVAKLRGQSTDMWALSPIHFEHFDRSAASSFENAGVTDTRGQAKYFCIFALTEALQDTWFKTRANEAFAEQWQTSVLNWWACMQWAMNAYSYAYDWYSENTFGWGTVPARPIPIREENMNNEFVQWKVTDLTRYYLVRFGPKRLQFYLKTLHQNRYIIESNKFVDPVMKQFLTHGFSRREVHIRDSDTITRPSITPSSFASTIRRKRGYLT